jgi:exosome complex component RRP4
MINMIKDQTHCEVIVGQNGVVWVKGEPSMERVAEKVINMIEDQAHTSGLTDRVRNMLAKLLGIEPEETEYELGEPGPVDESDELEMSEEVEITEIIEISEESDELEEFEPPEEKEESKEDEID